MHDPNDSLRAGDVVAITPGWRSSKQKRHVVKHIIAPSGTPVEERPPVPTEDERWDAKVAKKQAKDGRRAARREAELAQQRSASPRRAKRTSSAGAAEPVATSISDVD